MATTDETRDLRVEHRFRGEALNGDGTDVVDPQRDVAQRSSKLRSESGDALGHAGRS